MFQVWPETFTGIFLPSASCFCQLWTVKVLGSEIRVLWIAFIRDVASGTHPVSAWSAGSRLASLSPSAVHTSWSGNIDLLIPELQMSQSSWRPRSFQLTVVRYNKHKKTSVSPNDHVMDVGPDWWLRISCTWNIILSSASLCVQLSLGNAEAHPADTSHAPRYTGFKYW